MKLKTLAFATLMAFGGAAFAQAPAAGAVKADRAEVKADAKAIQQDKAQLKTAQDEVRPHAPTSTGARPKARSKNVTAMRTMTMRIVEYAAPEPRR